MIGTKLRARARLLTTGAAALAVGLSVTTWDGASAKSHDDGNQRINSSGKLRMLSQRVAAAACNYSAGIDADNSIAILENAQYEFSKILRALRSGDPDLQITGKETDPVILEATSKVIDTWRPMNKAIKTILAGEATDAEYQLITDQNLPLLETAKALVKEVVGFYATHHSDDDPSGKLVDISGRQRMLTQKMSKEACQIWSGDTSAETVASLQATMNLFETSLLGLRDGDAGAGLIKAPNPDILNGLNVVVGHWQNVKPSLEQALAGETLDDATRVATFQELNTALKDSNAVVGLYATYQTSQGNLADIGATERINFSGKLRMLSQRIPAAACNYAAGVEAETAGAVMRDAQAEFTKIIKGLEFGDADLRIRGQERRRKTLMAIANVNEQWAVIDAAASALAENVSDTASLNTIKDGNLDLLSRAKLLVSELSGQYSDPTAMLQADAILIDIAGRQRMLTQKMSKEACQIWSGNTSPEKKKALEGTMKLFEVSLFALRDGMTNAGVKAAPTPEILAGLDVVVADWDGVKSTLEKAVAGEDVSADVRGKAFLHLNKTMKDMNAVVGLYTQYAKAGL